MPATKRELTILFCDLRGSTSLAEQLPLADFMTLIKSYHAFVSQAVVVHYGFVVQFLGDGIMAYFGYPTAYEGAPAKAVGAGLQIANNISNLECPVLEKFDLELSIRVSVHTGTVVMAELGMGTRRETLALGEAPNIAA
ncbi:MAG: adenylate/guanylate cyclase domain-containing protein, partial [Saprospiraceae bacterium]|nr:adenylate/guanylate cyclase domain-containing protein [Saprospiraceae bacterium]